MRAVVVRQFGDPKFLKVEEVPTPEPKGGEALLEVKAAAIIGLSYLPLQIVPSFSLPEPFFSYPCFSLAAMLALATGR